MSLVVLFGLRLEHAAVQQLLQLQESTHFMPAYISQVVRTSTPERKIARVLVMLDIYLVKSGVIIVLHPEHGRAKKVVVLHHISEADGVDLFSTSDHFIGSVGVYVFQ